MKINNPFKELTKFEKCLWITSVVVVIGSFALSDGGDVLTLIASLIGVTALIFVAKGFVLGQVMTVVFAVFYGIISFHFRYYGEMLTYLCMTSPIALATVFEWLRHPYKKSAEVEVKNMTKKQVAVMLFFSVVVTVVFYFILKALGNANLLFSTISVTTSFLASYMTFMRSPYYAIGYSANDIVLIILWIMASIENISYLPMIACFVMFLANDLYGFINWRKMEKRQKADL
ncbi:MAG: nicotinamide mononucleotide transporter [Oscillospiraceae bacterium]|nr:nicotinamide mononucleotide transporter [Oscillospiraceae bacterium]MBQ8379132.1 nicotinamide mononucleotide transporter [Oscillospiraceae bacterium]MBQ8884263.1 nicotinamide mononucleotide transporter [Oscillospiraceae bacterium]